MSDKLTQSTLAQLTEPVYQDEFTAFLARAARDPSIDVDKLERLLAIKKDQDAQERKRLFFEALSALQAELAPIAKSGYNSHTRSRYVVLDDLLVVLRPLLEKHGFALSFDSKPAHGDHIEFTCELSHAMGHSEIKHLTLPIDGKGAQGNKSSMNAVQAIGSTTSYARRYLIDMHLNLARREDNDGAGAAPLLDAARVAELKRLLAEVGGNEARFLNWLGASSWESIPEANYKRAVDHIAEKKARGG